MNPSIMVSHLFRYSTSHRILDLSLRNFTPVASPINFSFSTQTFHAILRFHIIHDSYTAIRESLPCRPHDVEKAQSSTFQRLHSQPFLLSYSRLPSGHFAQQPSSLHPLFLRISILAYFHTIHDSSTSMPPSVPYKPHSRRKRNSRTFQRPHTGPLSTTPTLISQPPSLPSEFSHTMTTQQARCMTQRTLVLTNNQISLWMSRKSGALILSSHQTVNTSPQASAKFGVTHGAATPRERASQLLHPLQLFIANVLVASIPTTHCATPLYQTP